MRTAHALGALALGSMAMGCESRDVMTPETSIGGETLTEIPIAITDKLDLIFVVDDSSSMTPNQDALIANFPRFMDLLSNIEGGLPSVHIGVISTDVGADPTPLGEPFVAPNCEGDGHDGRFIVGAQDSGCAGISGRWIEDVRRSDGTRERNYDGDLADVFTCMASLGTTGCGLEMPFEALRRALEHPDNQAFFRDDAHLVVIFLTDEDDCSAHDLRMFGDDPRSPLSSEYGPLDSFRCTDFGVRCEPVDCEEFPSDLRCEGTRQHCEPNYDSPYMHPPEHFAQLLLDFKGGDQHAITVGGIFGDPEPFTVAHVSGYDNVTRAILEPSCDTAAGNADPGVRIQAFLDQFANRASTSICDGDLSGPIEELAARVLPALYPCVRGQLLDTQPDQPGIQPDCVVADVTAPGTSEEVETLVAPCDADRSNAPCWTMEPAPQCSATDTGLLLHIERADLRPPEGSQLRVRCQAKL
jgi:hypothetical protein